jgi:hypothetical protein
VHPDELDEVFNTEVGEGLDAVFANTVDPDYSVLNFYFIGDVSIIEADTVCPVEIISAL